MHKIGIVNSTIFKDFLGMTTAGYIDLILSGKSALFVADTTEMFVVMPLLADPMENPIDISCRLPRDILQKLLVDGHMTVDAKDGIIYVVLYNALGNKICGFQLNQQVIYTSSYKDKLQLTGAELDGPAVDILDLSDMLHIGRLSKAAINIADGVACLMLSNSSRVYKKFNGAFTACITAEMLWKLRNCNKLAFSAENYVCSKGEHMTALATKTRSYSNEEFQTIVGPNSIYKSSFIASIDFSNLKSFLLKMRPKITSVFVDINKQHCTIEAERTVFEIPIPIKDAMVSPNIQYSGFFIPVEVVFHVIANLKSAVFTIKQKKSFIECSQEDLYVLFSG